MLAVELAVEGAGDGGDGFVELGDFVGLEAGGDVASEGAFVKGGTFVEGDEEFEAVAQHGRYLTDANAVFHSIKCHGCILDLGRRNLVSAYVDDIVVTAHQSQSTLLIDASLVGRVKGMVAQHLSSHLGFVGITCHECAALTGDGSLLGDKEGGILHRPSQTANQRLAVVEVVGSDHSRLGRGVGVIHAGIGQDATHLQHVAVCHGCGTRLNEFQLVGQFGKLSFAQLQHHAYACRHHEGRHHARCVLDGAEEGLQVLHALEDVQRRSQHDYWKNL